MSVVLTVPGPMPVCLEISDAVFGPSLSASRILALFCPRGVRVAARLGSLAAPGAAALLRLAAALGVVVLPPLAAAAARGDA